MAYFIITLATLDHIYNISSVYQSARGIKKNLILICIYLFISHFMWALIIYVYFVTRCLYFPSKIVILVHHLIDLKGLFTYLFLYLIWEAERQRDRFREPESAAASLSQHAQ